MTRKDLAQDGFALFKDVLDSKYISRIKTELEGIEKSGTRRILDHEWARQLCLELFRNEQLSSQLKGLSAVQCTFFDKTPENNWLVPTHRDKFIPVSETIESEGWSGWSKKEGIDFVSPPETVLEHCLNLRLHLDDSNIDNGVMELVPGSHALDSDEKPSAVEASAGDVILFRPLLLHRSSKSNFGRRRVLQILLGPRVLPDGAKWKYEINWNV